MYGIMAEALTPSGSQDHDTRHAAHWNARAAKFGATDWRPSAYQRQLQSIYRHLVAPGQRVLEIGCGTGDLLAAVQPDLGVGVDSAEEMVRVASRRHPRFDFVPGDAHALPLDQQFDVIILSDLIGEVWDVLKALRQLQPLMHTRSRLIMNFPNPAWRWPWRLAHGLGLTAGCADTWLNATAVGHFLRLADFEVVRGWNELICPFAETGWLNRVLGRLPPLAQFAAAQFMIARPARPRVKATAGKHTVSVIVPARNEAGNIAELLDRLPQLGREMEIIFVEGHSHDDTYDAIAAQVSARRDFNGALYPQPGAGKGDAIRLGLAKAGGEILITLDADLEVAPEDLTQFCDALASGKGDLICGTRLVYPGALGWFKQFRQRGFSQALSWLLGQPIPDALCGVKAMWKRDYDRLARQTDPCGDIDLLSGAAALGLKIVNMPVRCGTRTSGGGDRSSEAWQHVRATVRAARRLRFF